MQTPEKDIGCLLLPLASFRVGLSLTKKSLWAVQASQGVLGIHLSLPSSPNPTVHADMLGFLCRCWEIQLKYSCLPGKHFYPLNLEVTILLWYLPVFSLQPTTEVPEMHTIAGFYVGAVDPNLSPYIAITLSTESSPSPSF